MRKILLFLAVSIILFGCSAEEVERNGDCCERIMDRTVHSNEEQTAYWYVLELRDECTGE